MKRWIAAAAVLVLVGVRLASGAVYTVTDLGFNASRINATGQVVGDDGYTGALWENGVLTHLPLLPGTTRSNANAINDAGQIVGRNWGSSSTSDDTWNPAS